MKVVISLIIVALLTVALWQKGLFVVQQKMAVAYIGRREPNSWGASVTACSGFTKRGLTLKEGQDYLFTFESTIDDGDISVEIALKGELVATLDNNHPKKKLTAEKGTYTITTRFRKASGGYDLKWTEK